MTRKIKNLLSLNTAAGVSIIDSSRLAGQKGLLQTGNPYVLIEHVSSLCSRRRKTTTTNQHLLILVSSKNTCRQYYPAITSLSCPSAIATSYLPLTNSTVLYHLPLSQATLLQLLQIHSYLYIQSHINIYSDIYSCAHKKRFTKEKGKLVM